MVRNNNRKVNGVDFSLGGEREELNGLEITVVGGVKKEINLQIGGCLLNNYNPDTEKY